MQPAENYSTPRRALDVEDYIDIVRRHKGWIFGPFLFTLVASVVGVYLYPDSYVSQAVVKIVPQQLPQNMVQSAINQQMSDRINSMAQTILSRTVLTPIINSFGLYQRERSRMPIEDVVEQMKNAIQIQPVGSSTGTADRLPAFAVSFSYDNRLTAQRVVQELVSRFIDENIRNRSNATFQTTQFMKDEMDDAKKQLDAAEDKLAAYRMQNNGRLPDQVDSGMRQLAALQTQAGYLTARISAVNQEKLQMESNVRIFKDQLANLSKDASQLQNSPDHKSPELLQAEHDLNTSQDQLTSLRQHYKDSFPDVQIAIATVESARKKVKDVQAADVANTPDAAPITPAGQQTVRESRDIEASIRRFESALEARDLDLQDNTKQLKAVNDAIKGFEGRMSTVPLGEKQYADLLSDRDLVKARFVDLSEKLGKAEIAQEMEGRKQGETLELLDPASLPTTPTEPKRPVVILVGAGLGLVLGISIAGFREMKDTSLKNLKDVRAYTQMSILGSVPLLENDFVVRRRRRLAWLSWTTACLAAAVVMSGSVVYYYVSKV
jgi:polysaccharide chain length determinant protein (PEP-CTERM system associated)